MINLYMSENNIFYFKKYIKFIFLIMLTVAIFTIESIWPAFSGTFENNKIQRLTALLSIDIYDFSGACSVARIEGCLEVDLSTKQFMNSNQISIFRRDNDDHVYIFRILSSGINNQGTSEICEYAEVKDQRFNAGWILADLSKPDLLRKCITKIIRDRWAGGSEL